MSSSVTTWLKFGLQQMAAEAYLDQINLSDLARVKQRLLEGNNDARFAVPDANGNLPATFVSSNAVTIDTVTQPPTLQVLNTPLLRCRCGRGAVVRPPLPRWRHKRAGPRRTRAHRLGRRAGHPRARAVQDRRRRVSPCHGRRALGRPSLG